MKASPLKMVLCFISGQSSSNRIIVKKFLHNKANSADAKSRAADLHRQDSTEMFSEKLAAFFETDTVPNKLVHLTPEAGAFEPLRGFFNVSL